MTAIAKLQPHRSIYLKGFDRRGAAAAMHSASAAGFTLSGVFSDQADFAVVMLYDADDNFGHLFTSKFLPDFSLSGVKLDFDVAYTNLQSPTSLKYQSVPWGALSYITSTGTRGTVPIPITAITGQAAASQTYQVSGTPVQYDRVQLIYLGNYVFDYTVNAGDTPSTVAAALVSQMNASGLIAAPRSKGRYRVTRRSRAGGCWRPVSRPEFTRWCSRSPAGPAISTTCTRPSCPIPFRLRSLTRM